jgi:TPR repeat protein
MFYLDGIGVEQNTKEALSWFKKAADNDFEAAAEKIDEIMVKQNTGFKKVYYFGKKIYNDIIRFF